MKKFNVLIPVKDKSFYVFVMPVTVTTAANFVSRYKGKAYVTLPIESTTNSHS